MLKNGFLGYSVGVLGRIGDFLESCVWWGAGVQHMGVFSLMPPPWGCWGGSSRVLKNGLGPSGGCSLSLVISSWLGARVQHRGVLSPVPPLVNWLGRSSRVLKNGFLGCSVGGLGDFRGSCVGWGVGVLHESVLPLLPPPPGFGLGGSSRVLEIGI